MDRGAAVRLRPGRLTAPGVALIAVCYGIARFAYGLFVPAFRTSFGLSDTLLGVVGGASYVGYCVTIVVASWGVAHLGARRVAVTAGLVATTGMAMVAAAPTPLLLATGALIAGSSTGIASPPMADAVARWLPSGVQIRAQSLVNAGPGVGIALSGPVALLTVHSWRHAWAAFAVLAATVTVWVWSAVPTQPRGRRATRPRVSAPRALTSPSARRLCATAAAFGTASSWVWTFGRDHLTATGGHTQTTAIVLWILLGVAGTSGAFAGHLIQRHGLLRTWRSALAALAIATATLGAAPTTATTAALAMATFAASYMTLTIVVFFAALELDPDHPATTTAFGFFMITLGQAIGAPLAGILNQHASITAAYLIFAVAALATATASPATPPSSPTTWP